MGIKFPSSPNGYHTLIFGTDSQMLDTQKQEISLDEIVTIVHAISEYLACISGLVQSDDILSLLRARCGVRVGDSLVLGLSTHTPIKIL